MATSAGSTEGSGDSRGLLRRAIVTRAAYGDSNGSGAPSRFALRPIAAGVLAIVLLLAVFAGTASAADPVLVADSATPGYTTAEVSGTVDPEDNSLFWFFEYAKDPASEGWTSGPEAFVHFLPADSAVHPVSETLVGLTPDTEYKFRLVQYNGDTFEPTFSEEPYSSFTTKHIEAPVVTQDAVTAITGSTAHISGTVNASAPDGALAPDQEAAYETSWHVECEPECEGAPSGVIQPGDDGFRASEDGISVDFDAIRLETNTTYEVKLVATNASGFNETVAARTFPTPLLPPVVKSAPGASDGQSGYVIEGIVNPLGSSITDCHFDYGPTAAYVFQAPCSPTPVGRTEVQDLRYNNASEGQFRLNFRGQETGDIDYGASVATVEAALKGLSTIGPNGIASVTTEANPDPSAVPPFYTVTFGGPLKETNVPKIGFKRGTDPLRRSVSLGGGLGSVDVTSTLQGGNNVPIVVEAHLTGLTPGATYHFQLVATSAGGTSSSGDGTFVPTQDPAQPPCPNEAVRGENNSLALPECRAYEQVTSPFKTGYRAEFAKAFEGKSVLYRSSASNIANSGLGRGLANFYVANRTATGWETMANLNPAGSITAGPEALPITARGEPLLYAEDLQSSFWFVGPGTYFEDESTPQIKGPDGRFTQIGVTPGGMGINADPISGASADLSLVILSDAAAEGRTIVGPGLYQYIGTGNPGAPERIDLDKSGQPVSECTPIGFESPGSAAEAVSKDGGTVFFRALGGCGAAGPPADEIWARVDATTSYFVSESKCTRVDCNAQAPAKFVAAADDGSSVFFTTTQQLVNGDTDETNDLYVYHLPTASDPNPSPALTEVSGTATGADVQEAALTVSANGSTAMFVSRAVLASNEDALEETARAGDLNLYVWRRDPAHPGGQMTFVGRLRKNDLAHDGRQPESTPDGRFLVLSTATSMTPTDADAGIDVYRYDADSGELIRVSTGPLGTGGNAEGFNADLATRGEDSRNPWPAALSISEDGQALVFGTSEGLAPRDGNGANDVYLWKAGQVSLISTGAAGNQVSQEGDFQISPAGQDIYFVTTEALSPSDGDAVGDVYDARVGGGFSFAEKEVCHGEECQPPGPGAPSSPNPETNQPRAPEAPPKKTCPKGKVLKKGKCIKKHRKHHKKHRGKRGAKHGGGK
jgi:Tol biopolymer transport system component